MPHQNRRPQKSIKYMAVGLLLVPTVAFAMDLGERERSLPLPNAMAGGSGGRLFSWYETPSLSPITDFPHPNAAGLVNAANMVEAANRKTNKNMSVLPFLGDTNNVDTSGTGLSGLQLEPLPALKVAAPFAVPKINNAAGNSTIYDVSSLFGGLPPASIAADPAALATLIRQVGWSGALAKQTKHFDTWISSPDANGLEQQPRVSYTYAGPRSYADFIYSQEAMEWQYHGNTEVHKPSPLFMLPTWVASNLAEEIHGSDLALLQAGWWTAKHPLPLGDAQLASRNMGGTRYAESSPAAGTLGGVDAFHLLDAGLSGITYRANRPTPQWLGQADVETIFSQAGHQMLFAAGPQYHTTYYTQQAQPSSSADAGIIISPETFFAKASNGAPTLYIVPTGNDENEQSLALLSAAESYPVATTGLAISSGSPIRLARGLNQGKWLVASQHSPFAAIGSTRTGFGMPDPATLSLLAIAGVLRTRTRKRQA